MVNVNLGGELNVRRDGFSVHYHGLVRRTGILSEVTVNAQQIGLALDRFQKYALVGTQQQQSAGRVKAGGFLVQGDRKRFDLLHYIIHSASPFFQSHGGRSSSHG